MRGGRAACHTGPVATREHPARIRRALASLRQPTAGTQQRLSRWAWTADLILAVFLAASTVEAATRSGDSGYSFAPEPMRGLPPPVPVPPGPGAGPGPGPGHPVVVIVNSVPLWVLVLAALTALPLALRRRFPVAAYCAVTGGSLFFHFALSSQHLGLGVDGPTVCTFLSCLIAAYSAAVYSPYRRLGVAALLAGTLAVGVFHEQNVPTIAPGFVPFVVLVPVGLAANTIHTWRQRMRAMEANQEAATRLAVDKERARIARELHDVVTHNVSMMTVQAGAARTVLLSAPDQAREALLAVEAAGRGAMAELRHVMGLLAMSTDGGDPAAAELVPQPGLEQVGALVDRVRHTGVPVELVVTGPPVPLPAGLDLAAYRVAQEALTNTVKHAAGSRVRISVDYRPDAIRIEVCDSGGAAAAPAGPGNGLGLIGLRERLAVYGGTLDAGRRMTGGFRVRAVLPVGDA